ncbi:MAG: AAA family ATPase [Thiotrichaceae bacterium]
MKFPYGLADFAAVISEGYYYADRTQYIHEFEQSSKYLLFLRPRRFGKSLILSMLENYYDFRKKDQFEALFGHLNIGKNPTPSHNGYFVLRLDFSMVDGQGSVANIKQALHDHINNSILEMQRRYADIFASLLFDKENALVALHGLAAIANTTPHKLYLLIDEYDNFANEVMVANRSEYEALVMGEGFLKTVFKNIKGLSAGRGIDRVFITGVSPVVMSDVSSGYNVASNITLMPKFADLCGLHEREIIDVLKQIAQECQLSDEQQAEALSMMRRFYNGYRFGDNEDKIYNPTLALYFLRYLQEYCKYPKQMLDSNLAMDSNRISYVASLPHGHEMIARILDPDNPPKIDYPSDKFGVKDMLFGAKDQPFMASLLFYLGVLTFGERDFMGRLSLQIPNLVIRRLYLERLQEMLLPNYEDHEATRHVAEHFYHSGDIEPLCDFIENRFFQVFDNRDYRWANELVVKTAFLTILFNDIFYVMDSEQELNKGYADLSLIVRPDMRQYQLLDHVLEFKYLKLDDVKMSGKQAKATPRADLLKLAPVQKSIEEATKQLNYYRKALNNRYKVTLRLHTYVVIALGFERLVFVEITLR